MSDRLDELYKKLEEVIREKVKCQLKLERLEQAINDFIENAPMNCEGFGDTQTWVMSMVKVFKKSLE